jgi:hypothetical protein
MQITRALSEWLENLFNLAKRRRIRPTGLLRCLLMRVLVAEAFVPVTGSVPGIKRVSCETHALQFPFTWLRVFAPTLPRIQSAPRLRANGKMLAIRAASSPVSRCVPLGISKIGDVTLRFISAWLQINWGILLSCYGHYQPFYLVFRHVLQIWATQGGWNFLSLADQTSTIEFVLRWRIWRLIIYRKSETSLLSVLSDPLYHIRVSCQLF